MPGLSALPEYKVCLSAWCPYSVAPEAELRLIVWGQLACWEGENKSERDEVTVLLVGMLQSPHMFKCSAESPRKVLVHSCVFSCVCVFLSSFCSVMCAECQML